MIMINNSKYRDYSLLLLYVLMLGFFIHIDCKGVKIGGSGKGGHTKKGQYGGGGGGGGFNTFGRNDFYDTNRESAL